MTKEGIKAVLFLKKHGIEPKIYTELQAEIITKAIKAFDDGLMSEDFLMSEVIPVKKRISHLTLLENLVVLEREVNNYIEYSLTISKLTDKLDFFKENTSLKNYKEYYYNILGDFVDDSLDYIRKMIVTGILVADGYDAAKKFAARIRKA